MNCATCHRDPNRMHSPIAECSHCECPHRKPLTAAAPGQEARDRAKTCAATTECAKQLTAALKHEEFVQALDQFLGDAK